MAKIKKVPLRKCVGCQQMSPKSSLLRIVKTDEGHVVVDTVGKKNGRGAYLCYSANCFKQAVRSRSLQRSLGTDLPEEILPEIEKQLEREIKGIETG